MQCNSSAKKLVPCVPVAWWNQAHAGMESGGMNHGELIIIIKVRVEEGDWLSGQLAAPNRLFVSVQGER